VPTRTYARKLPVMPTVLPSLRRRRAERLGAPLDRTDLGARLGLTVPHEWWPAPALVKSFEAAGFGWVQVDAPPAPLLAVAKHRTNHAAALAKCLRATALEPIVHAPAGLRLGERGADEPFAGLLAYAADIGASQVVYHALGLPDEPAAEDALAREAGALARHVGFAEDLGIRISIENLAPVYPGPDPVSASPLSLRGLALRAGSDAVGVCLDLGHAHIVAELRHTSLAGLVEPVADLVRVVHLHDNLGARAFAAPEHEPGVDPLRLDLHLPPGRGTLPLAEIAPLLAEIEAPIVLEVHPPNRPTPAELFSTARRSLVASDQG
jgi:sugar phosphate isomerase/epimerase